MILVVDGQRKQKKTGTDDLDKAQDMLVQWRTEERAGVAEVGGRIRYEEMRDEYLKEHNVQGSILRDLNTFFKGIYINAITVKKLDAFREWRESLAQVVESKSETIEKEIALRTMKSGKKEPSDKIRREATEWVENGVKATTDKRLRILRAMFGYMAKERGAIRKADIPSFPIKGDKVDNKNRTFLDEKDLARILGKMDSVYHPFIKFLYATGMRSGQAKQLTWAMVDKACTELRVPAELTKNKREFVLPLVDEKGQPLFDFVEDMQRKIKNARDFRVLHDEPIFVTTNFRKKWREACHVLKLGVYYPENRNYRGAKPHDFRRTACRNMVIKGIAQEVAMAISGHKTASIFQRYAIIDKTAVQQALRKANATS
ncbi:MAG TPA: site-specific integrase [Verrucomicrobiae bacterium]|nr:site-specific integrase [Verrucomicrobiae bacterium]